MISLSEKMSLSAAILCQSVSPITRKPVLESLRSGKTQTCSATEASWRFEISDLASIGIILCKQRVIKVLIKLCRCAG